MKIDKKIIVIKVGGEVFNNPEVFNKLSCEIAKLHQSNNAIVLVHGGGQQASAWEEKLGKTPQKINGRRITDEQSLDILKMVIAGKINIEILSQLQKHGIAAVGLSGVDGNILLGQRRPVQKIKDQNSGIMNDIDFGLVADIKSANPKLLYTLLHNGFVPVIAPLVADQNGVIYNVNADTVAAAIAISLQAAEWLILTNVDGVYDLQKNVLPKLSCVDALALIDSGTITAGMIPKVEAIISALKSGLQSARIINGLKPENLVNGTLIYA